MSAINLGEFDKLMQDYQSLITALEATHATAMPSKEKELLGGAIDAMREAIKEVVVSVPATVAHLQEQAARFEAHQKKMEEQLVQDQAALALMQEAYEKEEAARAAKRPTLDELMGPVALIDGQQLSNDLLHALHRQVPVPAARATPSAARPGMPVQHGDLWDWLKD